MRVCARELHVGWRVRMLMHCLALVWSVIAAVN